jgi:hypothetical protein
MISIHVVGGTPIAMFASQEHPGMFPGAIMFEGTVFPWGDGTLQCLGFEIRLPQNAEHLAGMFFCALVGTTDDG